VSRPLDQARARPPRPRPVLSASLTTRERRTRPLPSTCTPGKCRPSPGRLLRQRFLRSRPLLGQRNLDRPTIVDYQEHHRQRAQPASRQIEAPSLEAPLGGAAVADVGRGEPQPRVFTPHLERSARSARVRV